MDTKVRLQRAYTEYLAARQARYNELVGRMPSVYHPSSASVTNMHKNVVRQLDVEQGEAGERLES